MSKNKIILSGGCIPWLGMSRSINYALEAGYDGLEVLPTRVIVNEIENSTKLNGRDRWFESFSNLGFIRSVHQSWRLDIGLDEEYKINIIESLLFTILRLLFFPHPNHSKKIVKILSDKLKIPVIVHDISNQWTHDEMEFSGGIFYEIIGARIRKPVEIKEWLKNIKHKIVLDTRNDQSLIWAKENNFRDWRSFWKWIGVKNIGGIQVTLIGSRGIQEILTNQQSSLKGYLLWLREHKWKGAITVEVNPFMLFIAKRGKFKQGLQEIAGFIRGSLE